MCFAMDDVGPAREHWLAAEAHAGEDTAAMANAVAGIGLAALAEGDLAEAAELFERAMVQPTLPARRVSGRSALSHIWRGTVSLLSGDPDDADRPDRAGAGVRPAPRRPAVGVHRALQPLPGRADPRPAPEARRHLEEGIRLSLETGDLANLAYLLDAAAIIAAADGTHARVPLLVGAAQAIREAIGSHGYGYYRPDHEALAGACAEAGRRLGSDRYDDALDVGRAMQPEEAAALALGDRIPAG